ncbi:MAG: TfoX/Sxy family protein [Proteobacteria bacterium]|nr:TfoX/Sxy family protein [Pseudomonadota bacterium]
MAASPQFKAFLADLLEPLGAIVFKRLFGGEGLSLGGVTFAFIMGQSLYLRVDDETRPAFERAGMAPFAYDTKAKRVTVRSFYAAPEELYDDGDEFCAWARTALAVAQAAARLKAARKLGKKGRVANRS